jgi:hypothetical protein
MKYTRYFSWKKIIIVIVLVLSFYIVYQTVRYENPPQSHEFEIYPSLINMDKTDISPKEVSIRADSNAIVIHTFGSIHLLERDLTNYEDYKDYRAPFAFALVLNYDRSPNLYDLNLAEDNFVKIINNETGTSVKKPVESREPVIGYKFVVYFNYNEIPKYDGSFEILLNFESAKLDDYVSITLDSQFSVSNYEECTFFLTIPEDYNFRYVKANSYDIHIEEIGDTKIISTSFVNVSENPIEIHIQKYMIDATIFYGFMGFILFLFSFFFLLFPDNSPYTNNATADQVKEKKEEKSVNSSGNEENHLI